jgi:hypothetical protein
MRNVSICVDLMHVWNGDGDSTTTPAAERVAKNTPCSWLHLLQTPLKLIHKAQHLVSCSLMLSTAHGQCSDVHMAAMCDQSTLQLAAAATAVLLLHAAVWDVSQLPAKRNELPFVLQ